MPRLLANSAFVASFAIAFSLLLIPVANAYIDPGTGSMIFQAAIAAAMAVGLTLKMFWSRITSFFRSDSVAGAEPEAEAGVHETQDAE